MGVPYSKQINAAFDQVSPLVAASLEVLHTTRNLSYLLAAIQVVNAVLLLTALILLFALLITINPDLTTEREALVTPAVKRLASWFMPGSEGRWYLRILAWSVASVWFVGCTAAAYYAVRENDRGYWDGLMTPAVPVVKDPDAGRETAEAEQVEEGGAEE
ncbi:hypothetical protein B0A50_08079 [Salinomyces thailandicus]|uniref:Uncharacterized protein n=1 Tax=Salinomyces thailandicus TaxID=706561 RepID=A0A4U0TKU7_9PEZI|nr:hypothetical protein B0A50_08079 [Salinomyces thailandica]